MITRNFCILTFFFLQLNLQAQYSNLIIGSDNMEPFTLAVNGELINSNPQTQVRVDGLAPGLNKLMIQIVQKNGYTVAVKSNVFLESNTESYYNLKKNNRNEYVLRLYNMVPVSTNPVQNNPIVNQPNPNYNNPNPTPTNQTVINPQININIGGNQNTSTNPNPNPNTQPQPNPLPGYNGPIGCPYPISDAAFNDIKRTIQSSDFESSKLAIAKQVISSNCLLSKDVKEIMELFSFESSRLEFAKYAYGFTYDLGNYYIVNQAFSFESSIEELDRFIRSRR